MARTDSLGHFLTDVATAIRNKKGTTNTIVASDFDTEIASIESGGGDVSEYFSDTIPSGSSSSAGITKAIIKIPDNIKISGTSANYMFQYCSNMLSVPQLDMSNVTSANYMFYYCSSLVSVPLLDTSNVTSMNYMFGFCRSLTTIPLLNTSSVKDMGNMFNACIKLTTIPLLDTSNATSMNYMFFNCASLEEIPPLNTNKNTSMNYMFSSCSKLTTIPLLDTSNVVNIYNTFNHCYALKNVGGFKNLGQAYLTTQNANYNNYTLTLSSNPLTHDSLMNVINNLYDIATKGCNTQKLVLGSTNIAKLTEEEIAIATNKGWTIS